MEPVTSNIQSKNCPDPISSNCVTYAGPSIPGLNLCSTSSITDILAQEGALIQALETAIDLSGINLGCLYSPTIQTWTCPIGQSFLADGSALAINGTAGFCQICPNGACEITLSVPVLSTSPNPVPPPTTLSGILQLMISKIPCCDPCSGPNHT